MLRMEGGHGVHKTLPNRPSICVDDTFSFGCTGHDLVRMHAELRVRSFQGVVTGLTTTLRGTVGALAMTSPLTDQGSPLEDADLIDANGRTGRRIDVVAAHRRDTNLRGSVSPAQPGRSMVELDLRRVHRGAIWCEGAMDLYLGTELQVSEGSAD